MKNWKTLAIVPLALSLSGCWGDREKSDFVEFCVEVGGNSKGSCSCRYDFAKTELDEEVFAIVMADVTGDRVEAHRLRKESGYDGFLNSADLAMTLIDFDSKARQQCGS